ncbi:MAG: hypothetical protein ACYTAF_16815, partial [Planctomycetota bacterium]
YAGDLTEEGAKELSGGGRMGRMGDVKASGTGKIKVNKKGLINNFDAKIDLKVSFSGRGGRGGGGGGGGETREIEIKIDRTMKLSGFGETEFEIPEEAKSKLGISDEPEEEEE